MKRPEFAERVSACTLRYEKIFAERGGITPSDPLKFHLHHLARYWSRLLGFSSQDPAHLKAFVESDLGACVAVSSEFANRLIQSDSPVYEKWQEYWKQTQAILSKQSITFAEIESASESFQHCLTLLKYDPWA